MPAKNLLTVTVPNCHPASAESDAGATCELQYDVDNGEGEGSGIHFRVRLTPSFSDGVQSWLVRVEQNGGDHVPAINVIADIASPLLTGDPIRLRSESVRGTCLRRVMRCGDEMFVGGKCSCPERVFHITDGVQVTLPANGANETAAQVVAAT